MYKISEFANDGKYVPGEFKMEYQGRPLQNCKWLTFWFLWGDYIFDIRKVRKYLGRKETKVLDDPSYKTHPCTRFNKQMEEIISLVGDRDFEQVLIECAHNGPQTPNPKP